MNFWAPWCEPCRDLDTIFSTLAGMFPAALFVRIQAEEVPEISERYGVNVVPYFVLLRVCSLDVAHVQVDAYACR